MRTNFAFAKGKGKSAVKIQEGFIPFTERPSDKYTGIHKGVTSGTVRMTAVELFSLFTADIIKKKLTFVR